MSCLFLVYVMSMSCLCLVYAMSCLWLVYVLSLCCLSLVYVLGMCCLCVVYVLSKSCLGLVYFLSTSSLCLFYALSMLLFAASLSMKKKTLSNLYVFVFITMLLNFPMIDTIYKICRFLGISFNPLNMKLYTLGDLGPFI